MLNFEGDPFLSGNEGDVGPFFKHARQTQQSIFFYGFVTKSRLLSVVLVILDGLSGEVFLASCLRVLL